MRTIRNLLLLLTITLTTVYAEAQDSKVVIDYATPIELSVNGMELSNKTTVKDLIETIGEPDRRKNYPSNEVSLFYDGIGLVIFTMDDMVRGLGVNFNWDGDEKFPETSFTGSLEVGEITIDAKSKSASFSEVKEVSFVCPFPLMCMSDDREAQIKCLAAFEEDVVTQVAFTLE